MNFDFLKYLDYSTIITEIKKSKKDELLLISIALFGFVFLTSYLWNVKILKIDPTNINTFVWLIAIFIFVIYLVKVYRTIKTSWEYNRKINNYCQRIENLDKNAIEFLHKFIQEKSLNVFCENNNENIYMIDYINVKFWDTELNILKGLVCSNLSVSINNAFYEVLTCYFNK